MTLLTLYNIWPLPVDEKVALVSGLLLLIAGSMLTLAGAIEFRSLHRISGMEVSKLIATGIYRWGRNPLFLGFISHLSFPSCPFRICSLLTLIAVTYCHYYIVKVEEPYLERIFGKEYITYKLRTPRYLGLQ